jgi:hypothetical protein
MSDKNAFITLDLTQVQNDLTRLYQQVATQRGRIEIADADGDCGCVLISKEELHGLERALELLSDSNEVKSMQQTLALFAASVDSDAAECGSA